MRHRDIIFCVLIACHSKESTHLHLYSSTLLLLLYFVMRVKCQSCCARCSENGTCSIPANIQPGCGTNRLKNGTSRRKRDTWQQLTLFCLLLGLKLALVLTLLNLLTYGAVTGAPMPARRLRSWNYPWVEEVT